MNESVDIHATETRDLATGFVGRSTALRQLLDRTVAAARSDAPVFVTGECGSGKKMCARALHRASDRADAPFQIVNCATGFDADPSGVLFNPDTGAARLADGGTLVLDNVEDLRPDAQGRLLQFTQSGELDRTRGGSSTRVDTRIVCLSPSDLDQAVKHGRFRADLYYRLNILTLDVPPLRDRRMDIVPIAQAALTEVSRQEGKLFHGIDEDAAKALAGMNWPGNVRQLRNAMREIVVMNSGPVVTRKMLRGLLAAHGDAPAITVPDAHPGPGATGMIGAKLADIEQWAIEETIRLADGSLPKAARILDVAPSTLYRKRETWSKKPHGRANTLSCKKS